MPALTLKQLQEDFQAYILAKNAKIVDFIVTDNSNAINRIDIYRDGYVLRLLEILEKDYPILRKYMNKDVFDQAARAYITLYPSRHYDICTFGQHFSSFLIEAHHEAHLAEIAAFEWALSCALDAPDAPYINIEQLGSVAGDAWPYIQFDFHPSTQLYQFRFNTPQIVYALMLEQEPPPLINTGQLCDWIVWRYNLQSYFQSVTTEQIWMIQAIKENATFAEICEGLCQWLPEEEVATFAAGSLRNWIEKGLFSAIRVAEPMTT